MNLYTNRVEVSVVIVSWLIIFFFLFRDYGWKKALIHSAGLIPVLFFSSNMLCEAVTIDEINHYIIPITSYPNHGVYNEWVGQVRFSLIVFGTFFELMPQGIREHFTELQVYQIYKILHYFTVLFIILMTSWVWKNRILTEERKSVRWRLTNTAILFGVIGLPVSCLLLKTCNYDTYVYFAILGFSLIVASAKQESLKLAFAGVMATMTGSFEKLTALPYWCVAMSFFVYMVIKGQKTWKKKIGVAGVAVVGMGALALVSSALSIVWIKAISHLPLRVSTAELFDPFVQIIYVSSNVSEFSVSRNVPWLIFALILWAIFCASFIIYGVQNLRIGKYDAENILSKLNGICLGILIVSGVLAAFLVRAYKAPYRGNMPDEYIPTYVFNRSITYYGAESRAGHFLRGIAYAYATILCNCPTIVMVLFLAGGIILLFGKCKKGQDHLWVQILFSVCIWMPVFEVLSGQPSDYRYYGVTIIMFFVFSLYIVYYNNMRWNKIGLITGIAAVAFCLEMLLYLPNYTTFLPVWVRRTEDFKTNVRKGELRSGEAINWGEDFAVAGRLIKQMVEREGLYDYEDITVYSNYTITWMKDPGFQLRLFNMPPDLEECKWDETEYFVLSKCMLYRCDLPEIIENVDPVATVSYNGEISSWIYKGNQLAEYGEYIRKQMELYSSSIE